MIRGTTPTHIFNVDIPLEEISTLYVTYKQAKNIILEKNLNDVDIDVEEKTISVPLSQEDTLKFKDTNFNWLNPNQNKNDLMVQCQLRIKYEDGTALASNIILLDVSNILKDGEI